jgi:hypothetical protein
MYRGDIFQISNCRGRGRQKPLTLCKISLHLYAARLPLRPNMRFIFYIVLFYLLYKLIFDFVIPVSKATRQIKKNIRNVQAQQQQYYQQSQQTRAEQPQPERKMPPSDPEYIDFEEVK